MAGLRKRKVVENEVSVVKKNKPLTKKELEDLVKQLREELETEKGKVVLLDEEVLQLKEDLEKKCQEVEDLKKKAEIIESQKKSMEEKVSKKQGLSQNQRKNSTPNKLGSEEENSCADADSAESDSDSTTIERVVTSKNSSLCEEDLDTEELSDKDDPETSFRPNPEDMLDIMVRVKNEVDRQNKIRDRQLARKRELFPIDQDYTIMRFVNGIITCEFSEEYLQTKKLSNQKNKRGVDNGRKEMHNSDKSRIMRLTTKAWRDLPDITRKEIEQITRKAITYKLGNENKKMKVSKYK